MLELAKNTKKIEIFIHVSSVYVNSNLDGLIEEKIYSSSNLSIILGIDP